MKRTKLVAISHLAKVVKIKRIINVSTELAMMLIVVGVIIYNIIKGDPRNRLFACIGTFVGFSAPLAFEAIRGRRFTFIQHILLEIYMFVTMFLGSVLYFHHTVAPFDEISHVLFGYFSCIAVFYGFIYSGALIKGKCISAAVIIFFVSMGTAALWEIMEFSMDVFLGENSMGFPSQEMLIVIEELKLSGIAANIASLRYTSVIDTATDLSLHAGGALIFVAQYLVHRLAHKNVLLGSLYREVKEDEMNTDVTIEPTVKVRDSR